MVGITPWEMRYRNAIRPGQVLPNGQIADEGTALVETLEAVKDVYDNNKIVGIACAMKNAGIGVGLPDIGRCRITIVDGEIRVRTSAACIGQGIAIPHARSEKIEEIVVAVGLVENKIDFNSPDGEGVNLILLVGAPKGKNREYLSLVSELMRTFRNKKLREAATCASNYQELLEAIAELK